MTNGTDEEKGGRRRERDEPTVELDVIPVSVQEAQTRAEVDIQIATAQRYPRSTTVFRREASSLATLDEETAASCFYVLPREGKTIEGPSVRLAEIVANTWQHIRCAGRIIDESERFVVAQGVCHDLQRNVLKSVEVRRRIVDRKGRRYSDDMIVVTSNAAIAIATRNAVFQCIPRAYWQPVYQAAKDAAVGDARTLTVRREAAIQYFKDLKVPLDVLLAKLEVPGIEDITLRHLEILTGIRTAIADGDTTVEQLFPGLTPPATPTEDRAAKLADEIRKRASGEQPAAGEAAPATPDDAPAAAAGEDAKGTTKRK